MIIYIDYQKERCKWNVHLPEETLICHHLNTNIPPKFEIVNMGGQLRGRVVFEGEVEVFNVGGIITINII